MYTKLNKKSINSPRSVASCIDPNGVTGTGTCLTNATDSDCSSAGYTNKKTLADDQIRSSYANSPQ